MLKVLSEVIFPYWEVNLIGSHRNSRMDVVELSIVSNY